ncbi:GLE1-like domain-containing protein [Paramicrosporidium saccamoebae]|uniref:mRNA export factor GLE1 n=1 Tax=Paramicrosporidium saccamoebae TaxID=1246581 RepID=A0A2H9TQH2_9FUNG|nr:GLE1-like domain-containing protein [Paramicrosporidium saccamoebae]
MPSFGLLEDSDDWPRTSSTGTFRVTWDAGKHCVKNWDLKQPKTKTTSVTEFESNSFEVPRWQASTSNAWRREETDYRDKWDETIVSCQKLIGRAEAVLQHKKEAWAIGISELRRPSASEDVSGGLSDSFLQQQQGLERRIDALREIRLVLKERESLKTNPEPTPSLMSAPISTEGVPQKLPTPDPNDGRPTAIKRFEEIQTLARPILDSWRRIDGDQSAVIKDMCRKLRMNINRRIVQISNSREQVVNVVHGLRSVYGDAWKRNGTDLLNYCIVVTANKLVEQAETQVSLHSPSAFPIAQVVVDLSVSQKNLIPVLIYMMMKRCPYAVPHYIPRQQDQSVQDHKLAMGYLLIDGVLEGEQTYTERMAGTLCLYGAIVQAKPYLGGDSPYGISNAWLWMASVLNIHPQPITPYLICSFLEVNYRALLLSFRALGMN